MVLTTAVCDVTCPSKVVIFPTTVSPCQFTFIRGIIRVTVFVNIELIIT